MEIKEGSEGRALFERFYEGLVVPTFGVIPAELEPKAAWEDKPFGSAEKAAGVYTSHVLVATAAAPDVGLASHPGGGGTSVADEKVAIGGACMDYFIESGAGFLSYLVTDERHRGKGIGTDLLRACLSKASELRRENGGGGGGGGGGGETPGMLFLEVNKIDPSETFEDIATQKRRHDFYHERGFRALDFAHIQPPLDRDEECYDGCLLLVAFDRGDGADKHNGIDPARSWKSSPRPCGFAPSTGGARIATTSRVIPITCVARPLSENESASGFSGLPRGRCETLSFFFFF